MEQIKQFNVFLYAETNRDENGKEYHLLDLSKWQDDKTMIKQQFLYIASNSRTIFENNKHNTEFLEKLMSYPKHSKIAFNTQLIINKL
jgi:hypothetical protein